MPSGKPPITRHPLFPATVALWFGALFGIGSLAVRPALLESAIVALHLDAIISVPIGPTTRILIALALAGAGGLLGARLARRIGRPKPVARPRKRSAVFTARGTESPAQPAPGSEVRANRRTQLAIPDDGHGEPQYYDRVPVPGTAQILDVSQFGLEGFEPETEQNANQDTAPALNTVDEGGEDATFLPGPAYDEMSEAPIEPVSAPPEADAPSAAPVLPRLAGAEDPASPSLASAARSLFNREPAPGLFAQPLNARVSEIRWQDSAVQGETLPESGGQVEPAAEKPAGDISAADRLSSARLDDLAPIELLERLAISLREKRSRAALAADPLPLVANPDAPAPSGEGQPAEETTRDPTAALNLEDQAEEPGAEEREPEEYGAAPITQVVPPVPTIPAALQPIGLEPEDDEDDLPSFIPPRRIGGMGQAYSARATPVPASLPASETSESATTDALETDPDLEEGYSSLLNLSRPAPLDLSAGQRFVRIEEPEPLAHEIEPVVVFPSQMAESVAAPFDASETADSRDIGAPDSALNGRDPEETERALRAALANIQRMSGAA